MTHVPVWRRQTASSVARVLKHATLPASLSGLPYEPVGARDGEEAI
jgi:hypothetical protein